MKKHGQGDMQRFWFGQWSSAHSCIRLYLKCYYYVVTWIGRYVEVLVLTLVIGMLACSSSLKVLLLYSNMDRETC